MDVFIRPAVRGPSRRDDTSGLSPEGVHAKAKVCLVGANTGCKTNLVRKHVLDTFDDRYITTVGTKVSKKEMRLDASAARVPVTLDFLVWDIMSHLGFRELFKEAYFYGAKGILAVTDMTRRKTLEDLEAWIRGVESVTGHIPIVVIGANYDKRDRLQVSEEEVRRVAEAHGAPCFFASGGSSEPVEAAFRHLADAVLQSMHQARGNAGGREEHDSRPA